MEKIFVAMAVGLPLVGLVLGLFAGVFRKSSLRFGALGLTIGLIGPAIYGAWRLYNTITDCMGLDSTTNLMVQIVLFVILGGVLALSHSVMARFLWRRN